MVRHNQIVSRAPEAANQTFIRLTCLVAILTMVDSPSAVVSLRKEFVTLPIDRDGQGCWGLCIKKTQRFDICGTFKIKNNGATKPVVISGSILSFPAQ